MCKLNYYKLYKKDLEEKVNEIKKLNLHTWWGFGLSERMLKDVFGESKPKPATETNDDEAINNDSKIITFRAFPEAKKLYRKMGFKIY